MTLKGKDNDASALRVWFSEIYLNSYLKFYSLFHRFLLHLYGVYHILII